MKRAFLGAVLILASLFSFSQLETMKEDSWKVKWNKKLVLSANGENEEKNKLEIKKNDLLKKYVLEIQFKDADAQKAKEWKRTFLVMDENDIELSRIEKGASIKITAAELKKYLKANKEIKIYSLSIPKDPELAARVRVRRIHIVTLVTK